MPNVWSEEDQTKLRREIIWKMGLSGAPVSAWEIVKLLLERAEDEKRGYYDPAEGATSNWVKFGASVLDHWDLIEYGTGIGSAWLTDNGKLLLQFLNEFGVDYDQWPEWAVAERL